MECERKDELDQILDRGLCAYSAADPLDGLEQRVLNRVAGVKAARRKLGWWGVALAALAVLVIGVAVIASRSHPVPNTAKLAVPVEHAAAPRVPFVLPAVRRNRPSARKRGRPEQLVFPTPTPLTAEERALVTFVQRNPKEALVAFAEMPKREIEPISIQPIQIPPLPDLSLESQDGGQKKEKTNNDMVEK